MGVLARWGVATGAGVSSCVAVGTVAVGVAWAPVYHLAAWETVATEVLHSRRFIVPKT